MSMFNKVSAMYCVIIFLITLQASAKVSIWKEKVEIPTFEIGEPDLNPLFYNGRAYQGAQGHIYPYPILDLITDNRVQKKHNIVYLENDYVKIGVIPDLGGRIFSALDKTNNYDFFYRQSVIKPALIGMLGAWISGGVEWNVPHHHRASTYMPVQYRLQENPDGSCTVWIGETELRHRMKWIIGLTLFPDKSYLQATVKIMNCTPLAQSMLYWANVSVHSNENYQVIFPPSTQFATDHGKGEFIDWPVGKGFYRGTDFSGVDISQWKNSPFPASFFAWNYQDDFFAGYDYGKNAGTMHVADHHVVLGKKFFLWGNNDSGRMWDKILTETDGPYLELMVGAYSDNQPDYSWIQPGEVRVFKQYWYPIRDIDGAKNANLEATVNLDVKDGLIKFGFNTTSEQRNAKALVICKGTKLFEQILDISPQKPFLTEIKLSENCDQTDITASLFDAQDTELISYSPVINPDLEMPEPVIPPDKPENVPTIEELYFAGLRLLQFHNPARDPLAYFEEALKRDPLDSRVNTVLGLYYIKYGMLDKAEACLQKAVQRITRNYTRPKNAEAFYYLGIVLKEKNRLEEALVAFNKAAWDKAWYSVSQLSLAQIKTSRGNFLAALQHCENALSLNRRDQLAGNLKISLLRMLDETEQAEICAGENLAFDPFDGYALNELYLLNKKIGKKIAGQEARSRLERQMWYSPQDYIELASNYMAAGLWQESIDILERANSLGQKGLSDFPMNYYYLGYCYEMINQPEKAKRVYDSASQKPVDYCFPFRLESMRVFDSASRLNPGDANLYYYMGNLYFFFEQYDKAITLWEKSRELDDGFGLLHRNLGIGYDRIEHDLPKAITSYEKAIKNDNTNPRWFTELDILYERAGTITPQRRRKMLSENIETVQIRDDAISRYIQVLVQLKNYDDALDLLHNRQFHVWEGGGEIHNVYMDALLLRGIQSQKKKNYADALADFKAALEYPDNLQVAKSYLTGRQCQVWFYIAKVHNALGQKQDAQTALRNAAKAKRASDRADLDYYKGQALKQLNERDDANKFFNRLIQRGEALLHTEQEMDFFAKFGSKLSQQERKAHAHYLMGLGFAGQNKTEQAKQEFSQALQLNPNFIWAQTHLSELD